MIKPKEYDQAFLNGFTLALCEAYRNFIDKNEARSLIEDAGYKEEDFNSVDDYDKEILDQIFQD